VLQGGVGVAAIEIAKALGVRVIAAVSSEEKAQFCKNIGADDTIIYPKNMNKDAQKELSANIKKISGKNGIDVVYDAVGGEYAEPCIRAMAWSGRFLVVGFPAGIPKIPLNLALLKSCQIVGVFWGAFTVRNPKQHEEYLKELFNMYKNKKIKPKITASFSLKEADKALTSVEERKSLGKVVLTME
jgi:NADPH2:quinone reductase